MALTDLISPQGRLIDVAQQVDLSTVQHAAEIMNDRRTHEKLRNMWFWTADFPLYTVKDGKAVLHMATREHNLLFQHLDEAVSQLREKNNYFPPDEDIGSVVGASSTLKLQLSELDLKEHTAEWSYFEINTREHASLNSCQRSFAERVHGRGQDFVQNMEMLNRAGISVTRIYTLNPKYVKETLQKKKPQSQSLARACALDCFYSDSGFLADGRGVGSGLGRVRGVPKVGAADAQKISQYETALQTVLDNEEAVISIMQKQPAYAQRTHALLGNYLKTLTKP
ncbi:MAG: hypothetical protein V1743_01565 [Nanoarchaeota archaeon]